MDKNKLSIPKCVGIIAEAKLGLGCAPGARDERHTQRWNEKKSYSVDRWRPNPLLDMVTQ